MGAQRKDRGTMRILKTLGDLKENVRKNVAGNYDLPVKFYSDFLHRRACYCYILH